MMKKILVFLFLQITACTLFTPQTPQSPSMTQAKIDPLNFREIFNGIPSTDVLFTNDYTIMFSSTFTYYDDANKTTSNNPGNIATHLDEIATGKDTVFVKWSKTDSSKEQLTRGQTSDLSRSWRVIVNSDTLWGQSVFTVEYDPTIDYWRIKTWSDKTTDGSPVSFFDIIWKKQ